MEGKSDKTGVMIHRVISEVDRGAPLFVQEIPFQNGVDEDLEALTERIHEFEWKAIKELWTGQNQKEIKPETNRESLG